MRLNVLFSMRRSEKYKGMKRKGYETIKLIQTCIASHSKEEKHRFSKRTCSDQNPY